jgi:hypothetical protein
MKTTITLIALFVLSLAVVPPSHARTCYTNCYGNSCTTNCF